MGRLVQIGLVLFAVPLIIAGGLFAQHLTVRNISAPTAVYSVPYDSHGGTVYITETEQELLTASWLAGGALVALQLVLNLVRARRSRSKD